MKKTVRIFALLLVLIMITGCFVACNNDKANENGNNGAQTQAGGTVATSEGEYVSKLPDELDWGGEEYLVLGQNTNGNPQWENFEICYDELPSDIVGRAVWDRNDAIKQKYNVIIKKELASQAHTHIQSYLSTNEDKYNMVLYQLEGVFAHAQTNYLHDLTTINYIDFDHPAWNQYTLEQLTFGSTVFCATGDFNLQNKRHLTGVFYNREMARDAGDGYLEDLVYNNQWTLDKFNELARAYSADSSGNGTKGDEADTFGVVGDKGDFLYYAAGAGYRASTVTDGQLAMAGATDNTLNILSKVGEVYFDSQTRFITENVKPLDYYRSLNIFNDGRALFICGSITGVDLDFADISFEYGFLPTPKYDSNQEKFYSQVNPRYSSICAIPKTVNDTDFAGFGLEVLTEYSTETSLNAFVEEKCKLQDSFDQRMSDMFDLVFENPVYDLAIVGDFGNLRSIMMSRLPDTKNANRYSKLYNDNEERAEEEVKKIMDTFA